MVFGTLQNNQQTLYSILQQHLEGDQQNELDYQI